MGVDRIPYFNEKKKERKKMGITKGLKNKVIYFI